MMGNAGLDNVKVRESERRTISFFLRSCTFLVADMMRSCAAWRRNEWMKVADEWWTVSRISSYRHCIDAFACARSVEGIDRETQPYCTNASIEMVVVQRALSG